jgi:hypothetical protein
MGLFDFGKLKKDAASSAATVAILFLSLFMNVCTAQTKTIDSTSHGKNIKEQADKMGQSLLKKDYKGFAVYTYPKILAMMGGEDKMIEFLEKSAKEMAAEKMSISKVTFGEPSSIITNGKELQGTIPQTIELKMPDGRLVSTSTLIFISTDNGKKWYFLDTSGKDIQTMRKTFSNLSEHLVIPKKEEPVLHDN